MEIIHLHFETLHSTNDWAKEQIESFDRKKMTLITAEKQTGGKGQYNRSWFSPPKEGLYATFCLFVDEKNEDIPFLTQVMALSLLQLLESRALKAQIKWPNDILVHGKKIAGILCETLPLPPHTAIILGVGLNINTRQKSLEIIKRPATSYLVETGKGWDINKELHLLQQLFSKNLELFLKKGFEPFQSPLRKASTHKL